MSGSLSFRYDNDDPNGYVNIDALRSDSSVTRSGNTATVSTGTINQTLPNTTTLEFIDGSTYSDPSSIGGQIYALYEAITGRAPTPQPFGFWKLTSDLNGGGTQGLLAAANGMLSTQEGQQNTAGLSNSDYVASIYQNVLHRTADGSGQAYYTGLLNAGTATRAQVALGVVQSAEGQSVIGSDIAGGTFMASVTGSSVFRLYETVLGRLPDAGGLSYWIGVANTTNASTSAIANAFLQSTEFGSLGTSSNADFVTQIQKNVYGSADATATAYYTQQLNSGAGTRGDVVAAYEFTYPVSVQANQNITQSGIAHA